MCCILGLRFGDQSVGYIMVLVVAVVLITMCVMLRSQGELLNLILLLRYLTRTRFAFSPM